MASSPLRPAQSLPASRPTPRPELDLADIPDVSAVEAAIDRSVATLLANRESTRRSLPDVAAEVIALVQNPRADASAIEKCVERDPFVAAQLVSIANSAAFAPRQPILGVRDAVVRMGLESVRDIVLMVVTSAKMFRLPGFEPWVTAQRSRALATALASRIVARALGAHTEYAFLAGLLHDVGSLLLIERLTEDRVINPRTFADLIVGPAVLRKVSEHHQALGAAICQAWKLPSGVVDAAFCHHDYKHDGRHHAAANIVALADRMADHVGIGTPERLMELDDPIAADLGLRGPRLRACLDELLRTLPSVMGAG